MMLVNLFVAAKNAIAEWHRRRIAYEELMALSDRSLADIGVCRSQIRSIVYGEPESAEAPPVEKPAMRGPRHPRHLPFAS
ncbi:MAG TPA: DUF1127 domain-containing protein [Stellaceae bacterium]|nr:DUF1127 domain-containing protein [Stellaceae bacterium]